MPTSIPVLLAPEGRSPQLGVTILVALPVIVFAVALAIARHTGMSLDDYALAFAEYARTMM
ncbi:hypothetical protein SAMN05444161_1395 [Rhizobiales bacterium GAS191]|nr:hypothetical protein SAMN05444161_1395 [Rhizobiales bacterium GAS191]